MLREQVERSLWSLNTKKIGGYREIPAYLGATEALIKYLPKYILKTTNDRRSRTDTTTRSANILRSSQHLIDNGVEIARTYGSDCVQMFCGVYEDVKAWAESMDIETIETPYFAVDNGNGTYTY